MFVYEEVRYVGKTIIFLLSMHIASVGMHSIHTDESEKLIVAIYSTSYANMSSNIEVGSDKVLKAYQGTRANFDISSLDFFRKIVKMETKELTDEYENLTAIAEIFAETMNSEPKAYIFDSLEARVMYNDRIHTIQSVDTTAIELEIINEIRRLAPL